MAKKDDEQTTKTVINAERKAQYHKTRAASGASSLNNGDAVAEALAGLDNEEVYTIADKLLKPEEDLRGKYAHLNAGMQRMIVGNMIRALFTREDGPELTVLTKLTDPIQKRKAAAAAKAEKAAAKEAPAKKQTRRRAKA